MGKRKRYVSTASEKLYDYYRVKCIRAVDGRIKAFQNLVNLFCEKLKITVVPKITMCGVNRQNECIRKKGTAPCGGGCYTSSPNPRIYLRGEWGGYDTVLHELFHHVNATNNNDAIWRIMNAWHRNEFDIKRGYGKLLKAHNIKG